MAAANKFISDRLNISEGVLLESVDNSFDSFKSSIYDALGLSFFECTSSKVGIKDAMTYFQQAILRANGFI
eukprot:CAMPEP_0202972638 /NCGR_PEP_ID=MMETSP1396-20130829/38491_1 /ASSEMBLY_ACC=CAM_ASM_000872 /TAXON_ID= /ORGANISM="Pseudokeronopsis sp., Strain Brazil" /LENGTH=70 /DNA_ID=CAMNT_0049703273 /DNA_START=66 /DNA_END=278 /DNA_ORIENTATION=+